MRVIAGRFKGRQLVNFKAGHIRPTTDRVKETLFNILMGQIEGERVLDLFSGTGNLAIESLSRGASYVECVESHGASLRIIRENLKILKIEREVRVVGQDVFKYLKSFSSEPFGIVFIDPPFTQALAHACMEAMSQTKAAKVGTIVVIEASRHERLDDTYGPFQLLDRRQFGDKSASFYRRGEDL